MVNEKNSKPDMSETDGTAAECSVLKRTTADRRWLDFAGYLLRKYSIKHDLLAKNDVADRFETPTRLRDLWDLTDLSAGEFADEVTQFYRLPRLRLPELLAAFSVAGKFSPRFLRDMNVFPYQTEDGSNRLTVADPTDRAAVQAAEIV